MVWPQEVNGYKVWPDPHGVPHKYCVQAIGKYEKDPYKVFLAPEWNGARCSCPWGVQQAKKTGKPCKHETLVRDLLSGDAEIHPPWQASVSNPNLLSKKGMTEEEMLQIIKEGAIGGKHLLSYEEMEKMLKDWEGPTPLIAGDPHVGTYSAMDVGVTQSAMEKMAELEKKLADYEKNKLKYEKAKYEEQLKSIEKAHEQAELDMKVAARAAHLLKAPPLPELMEKFSKRPDVTKLENHTADPKLDKFGF